MVTSPDTLLVFCLSLLVQLISPLPSSPWEAEACGFAVLLL